MEPEAADAISFGCTRLILQREDYPVPVPISAMETSFESKSLMEGWSIYPMLSFQI